MRHRQRQRQVESSKQITIAPSHRGSTRAARPAQADFDKEQIACPISLLHPTAPQPSAASRQRRPGSGVVSSFARSAGKERFGASSVAAPVARAAGSSRFRAGAASPYFCAGAEPSDSIRAGAEPSGSIRAGTAGSGSRTRTRRAISFLVRCSGHGWVASLQLVCVDSWRRWAGEGGCSSVSNGRCSGLLIVQRAPLWNVRLPSSP